MNELVELERIDLASVETPETFANSIEQQAQLLFVIFSDRPTRGTASLFVVSPFPLDGWISHNEANTSCEDARVLEAGSGSAFLKIVPRNRSVRSQSSATARFPIVATLSRSSLPRTPTSASTLRTFRSLTLARTTWLRPAASCCSRASLSSSSRPRDSVLIAFRSLSRMFAV